MLLSSASSASALATARTAPGALTDDLPPARPEPAARPGGLHLVDGGGSQPKRQGTPGAPGQDGSADAFLPTRFTRLQAQQAAADPALATRWQALHDTSGASFFLSWHWISLWLAALPADCETWLVEVTEVNAVGTDTTRPSHPSAVTPPATLGLAILVRRRRGLGPCGSRLAHLPFCDAWYLHAGGESAWDSNLCIEHNDVLAHAQHQAAVRRAVLQAWRSRSSHAAELHLPGIDPQAWHPGLATRLHIEHETKLAGGVQLAPVRAAKLDFTPLLSSHSRRFVRRSLKEYQAQLGATGVQQASSVDEALDYFAALVRLHEATWQRRGLCGAFADPAIRQFHDKLIRRALPTGEVQLLKIHAGDHAIGYLYSFITRGQVYVYQSGFDYGLIEKHGKPGLVSHTLAIQHNAALGHEYYDLLAGESQYKNSVSTDQRPMDWATWRKPALRLRLEAWARQQLRARRELKAGKADAATPAPEGAAAED